MSKKRRARTRRQAQIRRQEQIRREATVQRGGKRHSEARAEERRQQRETQLVPLVARYRLLSWLLPVTVICLVYGLGLSIARYVAYDTLTNDYPGVWTGLLIGLAVAEALCWIPGVLLTFRDRSWFWLLVTAIPFTTIPGFFYYCFTRRRTLSRTIATIRAGGSVRAGPPRTRRAPASRQKSSRQRSSRTAAPSSTDSVKLLNDR